MYRVGQGTPLICFELHNWLPSLSGGDERAVVGWFGGDFQVAMVLMSWCGWRYSEWYRVNFPRYASPPRSSLEALATARCHLRCAPVRMRSAWQRAPASGVQIGVWSLAAVGYRLGLVWATGSVDELGAWCGGRVCAARSTASAPHSLRSVSGTAPA